uniref:Putative salivary lipocalin n=1 Tax=Panstrongylus lignarius TaxID=156445 RepID=A0A224XXL8_9HEMI
MKIYRIIAVTFLGILMHAFAEECELMPPADNLDLDKYFSLQPVYVTHSREGPQETVCREYKTTKISEDTSNTLVISDYKKGGTTHHSELKCTNKLKNGIKGQFNVECELPERTNGPKIQVETSVIYTDNKNYALLQTCTKTGSGIKDDILVLQTKKNGVDEGVKAVFKKLNWELEKWNPREKVDCNNI